MSKAGFTAVLVLWAGAAWADTAYTLQRATILYPDNASIVDSGYDGYRVDGRLLLYSNGAYTQSAQVCNSQACVSSSSSGVLVGSQDGLTYTVRDSGNGALYNFTLLHGSPLILSGNVDGIAEIHQWVPDQSSQGANGLKLGRILAPYAPEVAGVNPAAMVQQLIGHLEGLRY